MKDFLRHGTAFVLASIIILVAWIFGWQIMKQYIIVQEPCQPDPQHSVQMDQISSNLSDYLCQEAFGAIEKKFKASILPGPDLIWPKSVTVTIDPKDVTRHLNYPLYLGYGYVMPQEASRAFRDDCQVDHLDSFDTEGGQSGDSDLVEINYSGPDSLVTAYFYKVVSKARTDLQQPVLTIAAVFEKEYSCTFR